MKLAEALALRADLSTRLQSLVARAARFALVQEGSDAQESSTALITEHLRVADELEALIVRINVSNTATEVQPGLSMTAALARRDTLRARHGMLVRIAEAASASPDRLGRTELRAVPTVDVSALRTRADRVAVELRELDMRIQEVNWATELREDAVAG